MEPGTIFGDRYALEGLVGRGGMGTVYRARDLESHAIVAIKVLNRDVDEEAGRADRFKREIGILSRIKHAAVPAILNFGERDGALYFVSEFIDGTNLRAETARRGAWPAAEAAPLIAQVADALGAAHALGIVHRDVNANNIMIVRDGGVRLLDFGIARADGIDVTRITTTGLIMGTPGYMAPEQFEARPADARSDLYSLGVVLFEMLTGRLPFTGDTPVAVALQHKTEMPPTVRSLRPNVPAWLDRVVLRCLEKNPGKRFASAAALARELARASGSGPRRRRLPSGDFLIEDFDEQSDWALVLATAKQKTGWSAGQALRFDDRYYRLAQIEAPQDKTSRWTYRFQPWPEGDVFRGVIDYEQDCQDRAAADAATLRARLGRWLGGSRS